MEILTKQEKLNALLCLKKQFETENHERICTALGLLGLSGELCLFIERLVMKEMLESKCRYWMDGSIDMHARLLFHPSNKQSRIDLINRWISEYK